MECDLISVIVPIYNVEKYLKKCIDSILAQTYKNYELILVDDGSPDNCGRISDEYAKKDIRVSVIHKQNGGLSSARNAGLEISKGEYIVFIDSDDWIDNNYLECLYKDLKNNDADISVPAFCLSYENGRHHIDSRIQGKKVFSTEQSLECFLFNGYLTPCVASKMWKKNLWKDIKCPEGKLFEDQYTTYKLIMNANRVVYDRSIYYHYFKRNGSIGHSSFSDGTYDLLKGIEEEYKEITREYPNIKNSISVARTVWELVFVNMMISSKNEERKIIYEIQKRSRNNTLKIMFTTFLPVMRKFEILLFNLNFKVYKIFYKTYKKHKKVS